MKIIHMTTMIMQIILRPHKPMSPMEKWKNGKSAAPEAAELKGGEYH